MSAPSARRDGHHSRHGNAATTLYRHFDASGVLLYVGISVRPLIRQHEHSKTKQWWRSVASTTYQQYPDRETALDAERDAIIAERPKYNVVHRGAARTVTRQPDDTITIDEGSLWEIVSKYGNVQVTDLWLEWEINGAAMCDRYDPGEIDARSLLREFVDEFYPDGGLAPIYWSILPLHEAAPFQEWGWAGDPEMQSGMLAYFRWPTNVKTGERLNFLSLPVPDTEWAVNTGLHAGTSGFIQEATGWKPGALQSHVDVDMLLGRIPRHASGPVRRWTRASIPLR